MRPEQNSQQLLSITRSKAKMFEFDVPEESHIQIFKDPSNLFSLTIGVLGDLAAAINNKAEDSVISELRNSLGFSARFFDAYIQTHINDDLDLYFFLLGSAAYYLSNYPGSSVVLAKKVTEANLDLEVQELDKFLLWMLSGDYSTNFNFEKVYSEDLQTIASLVVRYYEAGESRELIEESLAILRRKVYAFGSARELLFIDTVGAIIIEKINNSSWNCLPIYTGLSIGHWYEILQKDTFLKEFWPAQHLIGNKGIFRGESSVIQIPTSAGKTRAAEIIIRSAFLSQRTNLAIIVAPFRALCQEIKSTLLHAFKDEDVNVDDISDAIQVDFDIERIIEGKQILVLTPEKFLYVLRQTPELADNIGVLIYDEGHQFDSGLRGVTFELLLTSLNRMIGAHTQKVLISAVISNADSVGVWLNGESNISVNGSDLSPTFKTIAFSSWTDTLGRLQFVSKDDPEINEFFVPRIIEQQELSKKPRERKPRFFPEKNDVQSTALYLGLKLVRNGGVAVFCGKKTTVVSMCKQLTDLFLRNPTFPMPNLYSNEEEISRIHYLYSEHFGTDYEETICARLGILTHHGSLPQGVRLAVEFAMKEGKAKFVICTSTLAQGVNIPIRYLIVSSIYQGQEKIKVRDFHNLIGRVGRSGMHTEGSIIFADTELYDNRRDFNMIGGRGRWRSIKKLLNPLDSEPCRSTLLSLLEPLKEKNDFYPFDPLNFIEEILFNQTTIEEYYLEIILSRYPSVEFNYDSLIYQLNNKLNILAAIESFLMTYITDESQIEDLVSGTFAYHLAEIEERELLTLIFGKLYERINEKIPDDTIKKIYGKTLFGVDKTLIFVNWVNVNLNALSSVSTNHQALLQLLWPIIRDNVSHTIIRKCENLDAMLDMLKGWVQGLSYQILFQNLLDSDIRFIYKTQRRLPTLENIVDICDNGISYEVTLIIGAIIEIILINSFEDSEELIHQLQILQKRLKYGVSTMFEIHIYEIGFSDRVISQDLSRAITPPQNLSKSLVRRSLKRQQVRARAIINKYPSYYSMILNRL
ncbi:DEAD/DEAH box helicase [Paenibacillus sp. sgz5001063]|uniref:DEAD/DEAH box helicase n=1 Tax=Paenibacillus sp. sgz5001063 TaxID=3242474 RepID=UPI0036D42180